MLKTLAGLLALLCVGCASDRSGKLSANDHYLRWVAYSRSGGDSLLLRWHKRQMPLGVYLPDPPPGMFDDPEAIVDSVRDGILDWTDVVAPGIPSFEFVDSHGDADIPIVWADKPSGNWYVAHCVYDYSSIRTAFSVEHILVTARWGDRPVADLHVLYRVMLHEMGHALGLGGHSPDESDVMFARVNSAVLSDRDKNTLRLLYSRPIGSHMAGAKRDR